MIIDQWDELQRIFVSLAQKTTTQSILVSKLSSVKRRSRTLQALWEYDHSFRSIYLLKYIDSPKLRSNVQRALNRGEQYHHLKKALMQMNAGQVRYTTDEDHALWNECSRLLANAILYYNMIMLGEAVRRCEERGDTRGAAQLMGVSPVAWTHIIFSGRYTFTDEPAIIPLERVVETMLRYPFETDALAPEVEPAPAKQADENAPGSPVN